MKTAFDFIKFALSHAKKSTLPKNALLPVPDEYVGSGGEWEYLFGTTGVVITEALLKERYKNYYSKHGWTEGTYNEATKGFVGRTACDCQGVLDCFLSTDVTSNYNYVSWCTNKGSLSGFTGKLPIATNVFRMVNGTVNHVGYICGYLPNGDHLVVEERGLKYGCVITKLSARNFTHYGTPTKKLDYSMPIDIWSGTNEAVVFEAVSPAHRGDGYLKMQAALIAANYTDADGNALVPDGVWGKKSQAAFDKMISQYAPKREVTLYLNKEKVYTTEEGANGTVG